MPKGLRSFDAEDKDFFLELLPGPRRGDGLPESVHFWKVRIEEMDPDKTFRVGDIFGPSGCGKSSLVKAGLLPRLSKPIIPIYIEATGEDTEARLLKGLRKQYPDLPADLDLRTALVAARERIREGSNKILLVIDQFEQWYHTKGVEPETELAKALSECDGGRVQAIIVVRDGYSMALHRFMAAIGVRQNQDQNFAVVDLFDLQHARKVLIEFGRGYGMLPDDPKEMTCAQNEFLDRTIEELSQSGRQGGLGSTGIVCRDAQGEALDSRDLGAGRRGGRGRGHVPGGDLQRPDGPAVVSHPPEGRSSRLEGTAARGRVQHQREHAGVRRTAGGLRLRLRPERV